MAAVLILIASLLVTLLQPNAPGIRTGKPLPPGKVRPQLVQAWQAAVLLAPDGSLWAWGGTMDGGAAKYSLMSVFPRATVLQFPRRIGFDSDWSQVASGVQHTLALKNDGSLWAWGWNGQGEVGQANLTNHYGAPTRIGAETNWTQISAGTGFSLALRNDGSLWAWGRNDEGQLGDGTTNNTFVPAMIGKDRDWQTIAAGAGFSFALKSNGTLWGWGSAFGFTNSDSGAKADRAWRHLAGRFGKRTYAAGSQYRWNTLAEKPKRSHCCFCLRCQSHLELHADWAGQRLE